MRDPDRRTEAFDTTLCADTDRSRKLIASGFNSNRKQNWRMRQMEPTLPYQFTADLTLDLLAEREWTCLNPLRGVMQEAVEVCRQQALAETELPRACFTAGRLSLLIGRLGEEGRELALFSEESFAAFGYYARGLRHCLCEKKRDVQKTLEEEKSWLGSLGELGPLAPAIQCALDLLRLPERLGQGPCNGSSGEKRLIVAGGAASMDSQALEEARPLLESLLERFSGVVISGGTRSGIPGCVGAVAAELARRGTKRFKLVGYLPENLPPDVAVDDHYDSHVEWGRSGFSPAQPLRMWRDLLEDGVRPQDVLLVGFGGGLVTLSEFHLGLLSVQKWRRFWGRVARRMR